jgi:hypothetical protein
MGRGKSNEDFGGLCKVVAAELYNGIASKDFLQTDLDEVCNAYSSFAVALLQHSVYPCKSALAKAVASTLKIPEQEASTFAERICSCISYCREKKKSASSCKKVAHGVKSIILQLRKIELKPSSKLNKSMRRELKRRHSKDPETDPEQPKAVQKTSFDRNRLLKLYGLAESDVAAAQFGQDQPVLPVLDDVELVASSQETTRPEAPCQSVPWLCSKDLTMKRNNNGTIEVANMKTGDAGFAIAQFGAELPFATELPNLLLLAAAKPVMKKPAAAKAQSKRAAKSKTVANKDDVDSDDSSGMPTPPGVAPAPSSFVEPGTATSCFKNFTFEAKFWNACKAEFYTAKSYIRHLHEGKWTLVIGCNKANHKANLMALVPHVKSGMSKENLVQERDILEAPDVS